MAYGDAVRAFGVEPPAEYMAACCELAAAMLGAAPYQRPTSKPVGQVGDNASRGPFVVQEADGTKRGRMVREHEDKESHMAEAANCRPPSRVERAGYTCRPDTVAAVRHCVKTGEKLPAWRMGQARVLSSVRKAIEPLNAVLRKAQPPSPSVKAVAGDVNLSLLCALVDSMDWPDTLLPLNFAKGFASVGDIADSGVYRPIEPELALEEFNELYNSIDATNAEWLEEVCAMLRRRATSAKPVDQEAMKELKAKTLAEAQKNLCSKPFDKSELLRRYQRPGGLKTRVLPSFAVRQGNEGKVRRIDDGKLSRTNLMQRLQETITTPSPDFPAHILDEIIKACLEMGMAIPEIVLGLDDLFAAYRRIPTAHPEFMVAAFWDVDLGQPMFVEVYGHCFGLVSSVVNFNRVPHLLSVAASLLFAVMGDHYFDDYLTVDLACAKSSAQWCLDALHDSVRIRLEPLKRKPGAATQEALGVMCDLQRAASGKIVALAPTTDRVREIIQDLERCQAENCMYPSAAESLFGRLNFVLKTTVGAIGRAATQPLLQRSRESSGMPCSFTPAMDHMLNFFRALLPAIPPLELPCGPRRHEDDPPVVVYTDASYSANGYSGLGIIIMDGDDRYEAGCAVPPWVLEWLAPRGQQINHLEALAAVAARITFPDVLAGRRVIHFIDNTVALSKAVHGYANEPDMATVTNALHVCDAVLGIDAWWEWVPSAANVADLPSRAASTWSAAARALMAKIHQRISAQGFGRRTLQLPTADQLDDPVAMMRGALEMAAAVKAGVPF